MYNNVVMESSAMIRQRARRSIGNNWVKGAVGLILYYALTDTIAGILDILINKEITLMSYAGEQVQVGVFGYLYDIVTTPVFTFGLFAFILTLVTRHEVKYELFFEGFGLYLKVFVMAILMGIKIILWTFLFIIPGILAAINYSQSFFILFEDPSKSPSQCINESIRLMRGNKLSFMILCLSFIGWLLLATLASSAVALPLTLLPTTGIMTEINSLISFIPATFIALYFYAARAEFYQLTKPVVQVFNEE